MRFKSPKLSDLAAAESLHLYFTFGLPRSLITTSSPPVGPPVPCLDLPPRSRDFHLTSHSPDQATRHALHPSPLRALQAFLGSSRLFPRVSGRHYNKKPDKTQTPTPAHIHLRPRPPPASEAAPRRGVGGERAKCPTCPATSRSPA